MGRLLSAQQAAEQLGVSIWTVSRLARSGRLGSIQIGRRRLFAEEDLNELIRKIRKSITQVGAETLAISPGAPAAGLVPDRGMDTGDTKLDK